jgi:AraC family transcriptional regulator
MDWLKRMENALDWIENRLTEPLAIDDIAAAAHTSPYHFQRMFAFVTGMTVAEYIRNRRLTLAARELAMSDVKVIDVALKYGYDSPESFTKAFRRLHGIPPSEARRPGTLLKAFPRISFQLSLKGDKPMDYRIEERESFTVVGKPLRTRLEGGQNLREIPKYWETCSQDGTTERLLDLIRPDDTMYGICTDYGNNGEFTYLVAVEAPPEKAAPDSGFEASIIPGNTWAVFTCTLPEIQPTWARIFQEWLPSSGYEVTGGPELEKYVMQGDELVCEIWIPVVNK